MRPAFFKLLKFLAVGIPAFLISIPLNYVLVDRLTWPKPPAYALVLTVQVIINFFACIYFVFKRDVSKSLAFHFTRFMTAILTARALDWALYSLLVSVVPLHYIVIQIFNASLFSILKFALARRAIEGRSLANQT
jgi:putative flippase GtrA